MHLFSNCRRWAGYVAILSILLTELEGAPVVQCGETLQAMAAASGVMTVTTEDDGREVTIPVGRLVIVRLEAKPGTGYGWQLVRDGSPQLHMETPPVFEPRSKLEAGGDEDEVFQFRVQMPGTVDLEFHYRRPWDKQSPAAKTFRVRITSE